MPLRNTFNLLCITTLLTLTSTVTITGAYVSMHPLRSQEDPPFKAPHTPSQAQPATKSRKSGYNTPSPPPSHSSS